MVNEWIEPIYNRTYADIQNLMTDTDYPNTIGAYNDFDPNRVENNTAYVLEYMLEHKIIHAQPALRIRTDWREDEIIVASEMKRIVENVAVLRGLSNPAIIESIPEVHLATQMNYLLANDIERALDIMHTQPELPANYFTLTLNNGIILSVDRLDGTTEIINSNVCLMAEDEIAHIAGIAPEPDSQSKRFTNWSGNTDDLQYIGNVEDSMTTYTGQYHDVEFTANFKTMLPRTLTLTNAYISLNGDDHAESGPSSGVYSAGDSIMIIANVAPLGKAFYCWEGTTEALDGISVADLDPSTIWLAMPDCDVQLWPKYVNAGQHYLSVTNGSGSGYYNYGETPGISANVPENYGFDNWSGDTKYLDDIYSANTTVNMPDVQVSVRANYSYRYGYYNVQIIDGLINGASYVQGARESSSLALTATPPNDNYGLDYWSVEGAGTASTNYFYVGKGNAIITGHYAPYKTLIVNNINNAGDTTTIRAVQGHSFGYVETALSINNYHFRYWEENGQSISTNNRINLTATDDREITAIYEYVEPTPPPVYTYYDVTSINAHNSGEQTTESIREGNYINYSMSTTEEDYIMEGYYVNGTYNALGDNQRLATINMVIMEPTTITYVYRPREYYDLTVINGIISSTSSSSGTFKERQSVQIQANTPPTKSVFKNWNTTSGTLYSSPYGASSYMALGRSNATVEAIYQPTVDLTVITNAGTTVYTLVREQSVYSIASPYPDLYQFSYWRTKEGDATFSNYLSSSTYIYAQYQDSVVEAQYEPIPWYKIHVINGYVQINGEWMENGEVIRNSAPYIKMKPAPESHQFLQWEIVEGSQNDVSQPLAETTTLRNVTHDITVRATYYIPNPEVTYTLTVTQKDGTIETYNYPVGEQINISAQSPGEGYRFYRWNGDYQYLVGGRYMSDNVVNMPANNIALQPSYVREGYVTKYHIYMYSAECIIGEDDQGHPIWGTDGEFEEGTTVYIRAKNIPYGWNFNEWTGETPEQTNTVHDKYDEYTYLTVEDFDIHMSATIIEENKFTMRITNGQTSGEYYEDARVDIYFDKVSTDTEHYTFVRWTGDVQYLTLYDGGVFDVTKAGTSNDPQYVKMPARRIEITGTYTSAYKVTIVGGHILDTQEQYFTEGTTINITADVPEGKVFSRWTGNTDGIGSIYDPTTTVLIGNASKQITAVFSNPGDRNSIGYGLISFISNDIININDINIISGELGIGFIITDSKGHFYVVTRLDGNNATIVRMTKIYEGGEVYE